MLILGDPSTLAPKPKRRWFFKIQTIDDAEYAMKIAYQCFYALAILQAIVLGLFLAFDNEVTGPLNLFDPALLAFLAWMIQARQSRTAAVVSLVYSVFIVFITLSAFTGTPIPGTFGGKNIFLAAIAVYAAYMGIQGSFKYHLLRGSRVNRIKLAKKAGLTTLYVVAVFALIVFLIVFAAPEAIWGTPEQQISDDALGAIVLLPMFVTIIFGALGFLPGTKVAIIELAKPDSSNQN